MTSNAPVRKVRLHVPATVSGPDGGERPRLRHTIANSRRGSVGDTPTAAEDKMYTEVLAFQPLIMFVKNVRQQSVVRQVVREGRRSSRQDGKFAAYKVRTPFDQISPTEGTRNEQQTRNREGSLLFSNATLRKRLNLLSPGVVRSATPAARLSLASPYLGHQPRRALKVLVTSPRVLHADRDRTVRKGATSPGIQRNPTTGAIFGFCMLSPQGERRFCWEAGKVRAPSVIQAKPRTRRLSVGEEERVCPERRREKTKDLMCKIKEEKERRRLEVQRAITRDADLK